MFHEKTALETHDSVPLVGAYVGLREVFAEYSRLSAPVYPTTSILPYYDGLTALYGGPVDPPLALMRDVIGDLLIEGRGREAGAAFDRMVAIYGEPADAAERRAEIAEVSSRPPPAETVESLLATPFPTPEEAAHLLGVWDGDQGRQNGPRNSFMLELKVVDGRVTGQVTMRPAPDVELVTPLQYLTIRRDGFTYGYMNGMRPRGMLLFRMTREGDEHVGEMQLGGVTMSWPGGQAPPRTSVRLGKRR